MEFTITIKMDAKTGQMSVSAPMDNKVLCYGMLESAKMFIHNFVQPAVLPATPRDILSINGKR